MTGYFGKIEDETVANTDYRRVIYTGAHLQLVIMCLQPGEEIGNEVHDVDQFIRIEAGQGQAVLNNSDNAQPVGDGSTLLVPAGAWHNIVNTGTEALKLYTVYGPPNHKDGIVQATKADEKEEHFDGVTTEGGEHVAN